MLSPIDVCLHCDHESDSNQQSILHRYLQYGKKKTNTKPRFELSTQARQHSISGRGKSARYAREFSFARCHDEAGAITLVLILCCDNQLLQQQRVQG